MIATIWIALALFVAGELRTSRRLQPAAGSLFLLGAVFAAAHLVWAMQAAYGWDHAAAIEATARQTQAVFGLRWGGGVFVNYVFVGVWLVDAIARLAAPSAQRSRALVWSLRAFYFTVIVNAAVVFAAPGRRWMGLLICVALIVIWKGTHEGMKELKET